LSAHSFIIFLGMYFWIKSYQLRCLKLSEMEQCYFLCTYSRFFYNVSYYGPVHLLFMCNSAAKPDPFFWVEPDFGPKIRVESGRVGPQGQNTGPIRSGWPQIGFKFGFNPIMYLINPNEPNLNPISGRVGPPGSKFRLIRVGLGPQGPNSGWVGLGWSGSFGCTSVRSRESHGSGES
jgi:hypothetical protein